MHKAALFWKMVQKGQGQFASNAYEILLKGPFTQIKHYVFSICFMLLISLDVSMLPSLITPTASFPHSFILCR